MGVKIGHVRRLQNALGLGPSAAPAMTALPTQTGPSSSSSDIRSPVSVVPTIGKKTLARLTSHLEADADPASTHLTLLKKKRTSKPKRDARAPEKPLNAYLLFIAHEREKLQETLGHEVIAKTRLTNFSSQWGQKWKSMSAEQKAPYEQDAQVRKAQYMRAMEAYKQTQEYANHVKYVESFAASTKSPKRRSDSTLQTVLFASHQPDSLQNVFASTDHTALSDALLALLEDGANSDETKQFMVASLLQQLPPAHTLHRIVQQSRAPVESALAQEVSQSAEERERSLSLAPTVSPSVSSSVTLQESPVRVGTVKSASVEQVESVQHVKAPSLFKSLPPLYPPMSEMSESESEMENEEEWESDGINEPY